MSDTTNYKKGDLINFTYNHDDYEGVIVKNLKNKMVINVLRVNGYECYIKCYGINEYKYYTTKYSKDEKSVGNEYNKNYIRII